MMLHPIMIQVPRFRFSKYAYSMQPHVRLGGPTAKLQDVLVPCSVVTCSVKAMYPRRDIVLSSAWDTTLIVR